MIESIKTTFLLTVSIFIIFEANCQIKPCPRFFEYNHNNEGYYGVIALPAPNSRQNLVQVSIAIPGKVSQPEKGGLKLLKTLDLQTTTVQQKRNIKLRLDFPHSEAFPIIKSITLNNKTICKGNSENYTSLWSYNYTFTYSPNQNYTFSFKREKRNQDLKNMPFSYDVFPKNPFLNGEFLGLSFESTTVSTTTSSTTSTTTTTTKPIITSSNRIGARASVIPDNGSWIFKYKYFDRCGRPATGQVIHTIIGGEDTMEGQFPWMVAIYQLNVQKTWDYSCGGSLISDRHVLTAAHCLPQKSEFRLELGRYNLENSNEQYETRLPKSIFRNSEYIPGTGHADIAVILISKVILSTRIIPVCIWGYGNHYDGNFIRGYISGWGIKERGGDRNNVLLTTSADKTTLEVCQNSHRLLRIIATAKTFCAKGNTTGSCNGDSGSGFLLYTSNGYFLRGIISTSIGQTNNCNIKEYSVYVDVIFFLDWIRSIII